MSKQLSAEQLMQGLQSLAKAGIRTDSPKLKRDMVCQFSDTRLWIREYVVNAFDAGARTCTVSGREDERTITIIVEDDGSGMNRERVEGWAHLFRSIKNSDRGLAQVVGQFGIGKLSPAAMPGQCAFLMIASTGDECWRLKTGCLLNDSPLRFERVTPVPPRGTRFEITFTKEELKASKSSLQTELKALHDILERFVPYLSMTTIVYRRDGEGEAEARPHVVRAEWGGHTESFGASHQFTITRHQYEAILGIGEQRSELYQRRVLVTDHYDLVNMGSMDRLYLPHLVLRVDAPDLDLVFGRHRVADEGNLRHLASHLKRVVLPRFVSTLFERYREGSLRDYGVTMMQAEEIAVAMMAWEPDSSRPWSHLPVFPVLNYSGRPRFSLNDLVQAAHTKGGVYIAGEGTTGTDFSVFDAPVLAIHQPAGSLEVLKKVLGSRLVNLGAQDVAIEAPAEVRPALGKREKTFQAMLQFHPAAVQQSRRRKTEPSVGNAGRGRRQPTPEEHARLLTVCEEAQSAWSDLESISWRVGYLVQRDGRTPSRSHRYIVKNASTVLLNLYHPEVARLLVLSEHAPALAGHWAMASCFCDGTSILPHLTMEAREDLVLLDGMAKVGIAVEEDPGSAAEESAPVAPSSSWVEFMRNAGNPDFGLA